MVGSLVFRRECQRYSVGTGFLRLVKLGQLDMKNNWISRLPLCAELDLLPPAMCNN